MSIYTLVEDDSNTWECSECREWWSLECGTPEDNRMNYCPKCGSKITDIKIETLDELVEGME
jgi:Zn finger protein HypA/HybF involved in hydrogenase expression